MIIATAAMNAPPRLLSIAALSAVSVAARSGLLADALTKPMMVLDLPAAKRLLDRYPGAGAVWIDKSARIVATRDLSIEGAGLAPSCSPSQCELAGQGVGRSLLPLGARRTEVG